MTLTSDQFDEFFEAVHGVTPFIWQRELASQLGAGHVPGVIDCPTGLGKTAVIDAAVFALASRVQRGEDGGWTRLFFVVDRRLVVDAAFDRATRLATALDKPSQPLVAEVADALRSVADGATPLVVARMRGGLTWESSWLDSPVQPAVVVSTLDQFGSRLLFRGYGSSKGRRPIDAALCGTDALVVVDEAHLAEALMSTARDVGRLEAMRSSVKPMRVIAMSATVRLPPGAKALTVDPDAEAANDVAARRLGAHRLVHLAQLDRTTRDDEAMAEALRVAAIALLDGGAEVVGVVVNTVAMARAVFDLFSSHGEHAILVIGRNREPERALVQEQLESLLTGRRTRGDGTRLVLVATQTIEVGADLDLDGLVSEAAPLDSLLQRLGRVDRDGLMRESHNVVVWHPGAHRSGQTGVYGDAIDRTWRALGDEVPVMSLGAGTALSLDGAALDLGYHGRTELLARVQLEDLVPPGAAVPAVLPGTIDLWARTSPEPMHDQPVAPFIHGLAAAVPTVSLCWRADVGEDGRGLDRRPGAHELVELPIHEARRFLGGATVDLGDIADIDGSGPADDPPGSATTSSAAWRVSGEEPELLIRVGQIRPGDVVVVASERGGLDEWGWAPNAVSDVPDVADFSPRHTLLRVSVPVLKSLLGPAHDEVQKELADLLAASEHTDDDRAESEELDLPGILATALAWAEGSNARFAENVRQRLRLLAEGAALRWVADEQALTVADTDRSDGDDELDFGTSQASKRVPLARHLADVAEAADDLGRRLNLPEPLVEAVRLAALGHDLGKADLRFQTMLFDGDPWAAELADEPLAKSAAVVNGQRPKRQQAGPGGWPSGRRHEDVSAAVLARLLVDRPEWFGDTDPELVIHLAQSHHGWGRPLSRTVVDRHPIAVSVDVPNGGRVDVTPTGTVDLALADRFDTLQRRYGWWGLALLEALVRLADIDCSKRVES